MYPYRYVLVFLQFPYSVDMGMNAVSISYTTRHGVVTFCLFNAFSLTIVLGGQSYYIFVVVSVIVSDRLPGVQIVGTGGLSVRLPLGLCDLDFGVCLEIMILFVLPLGTTYSYIHCTL